MFTVNWDGNKSNIHLNFLWFKILLQIFPAHTKHSNTLYFFPSNERKYLRVGQQKKQEKIGLVRVLSSISTLEIQYLWLHRWITLDEKGTLLITSHEYEVQIIRIYPW